MIMFHNSSKVWVELQEYLRLRSLVHFNKIIVIEIIDKPVTNATYCTPLPVASTSASSMS